MNALRYIIRIFYGYFKNAWALNNKMILTSEILFPRENKIYETNTYINIWPINETLWGLIYIQRSLLCLQTCYS